MVKRLVRQGVAMGVVFGLCAAALGAPAIWVAPTTLTFSDVALGASGTRELTIVNMGDEDLIITDVATDNGAFAPDKTSLVIVPSGGDAVVVTFTPAALGAAAGTLTISSNDPANAELEVPLIGTSSSVEADIDFNPDTLNTRSMGLFVTAYIEMPGGVDPNSIDVGSVTLTYGATVVNALAFPPPMVGDRDEDGVEELSVKFSRQALAAALRGGGNPTITVTVAGVLNDGTEFSGADEVRVLDRGAGAGPGNGIGNLLARLRQLFGLPEGLQWPPRWGWWRNNN